MRTRIVYYSRSGTTRLLAEALTARLVGDCAEIRCNKYRRGVWGYMSAGRDAMRGATPAISFDPPTEPADCLLIGTPIWAGQPAAPVQSYLSGLGTLPDRVGVFITSGGPPPQPRAQATIRKLLGREPDGWMMLGADDVKAGRHMDEIENFLRAVIEHVSPAALTHS